MSTRSFPDSVTAIWKGDAFHQDGTTSVIQPPSYSTAKWTNSVTFGDNIKGWRNNLREGLSATTSMTGTMIEARLTNGSLEVSRPDLAGFPTRINRNVLTGSLGLDPTPPSGNPANIDVSKANTQALGKFNRRILEVHTAFNGGVFLGELGQTLRTIRNPAKGLRGLADDWRAVAQRIRRASSRLTGSGGSRAVRNSNIAQNLSDAWLEVQFGWRPLLNDVDDGCKALAILKSGQSLKTRRVTARSEVDGNPVEVTSGQALSLCVWTNVSITVDHSEVIYRGAVRVEPRNPAQMKAELLGFNPASWLPTAWELVPYSFLIDYFTNVGEIIEGWSALFTRLAWCNRTVRTSYKRTLSSHTDLVSIKKWSADVNRVAFVPAGGVITKSRVSREKFEGTRVPDFKLEIPGMGSLKWLNIAALIASRNGDRKWSYGD